MQKPEIRPKLNLWFLDPGKCICCSSVLSIPNADYILSQMKGQASTGDLPCHFWLLKWNVMSNINLTIYDLSKSAFWSNMLGPFHVVEKAVSFKVFKEQLTKRKEACLTRRALFKVHMEFPSMYWASMKFWENNLQ